ncbi:MAG: hypothetical protein WD294_14190 [Phycisphaeraceae bacterium]
MSDGHQSTSLEGEKHHLGDLGGRIVVLAGGVGIVALAVAIIISFFVDGGLTRFGLAYLTAFGIFLSISVGALFFVIIQHLVRAGWSVVVRRLAEVMAANLMLLAILAVPILILAPHIYHHWVHPGEDVVILGKTAWLNLPFFVVRIIIYFAILVSLAWWFWHQSLAQDENGGTEATHRMQWWSGLALVVFGIVVMFMPMDLFMTLDAHWYSTIFGVYFFAGGLIGFFAAIILMLRFLQRNGLMKQAVTIEHYHDLGKFLFGFTFFWGYIAFSQYMLIWYARIPEVANWYATRGATTNPDTMPPAAGWAVVSLFLLFFHFLIPFAGQLSRWTKRHTGWLAFWAVWMLVAHAVDHYWLVMPELKLGHMPIIVEVLCIVGIGGLWIAGVAKLAGERSLLPTRDPRLSESLALENY